MLSNSGDVNFILLLFAWNNISVDEIKINYKKHNKLYVEWQDKQRERKNKNLHENKPYPRVWHADSSCTQV